MPDKNQERRRKQGGGAMSLATAFQAVNSGNKKPDNLRKYIEFHTPTDVALSSQKTVQN
jgi:hypothetical protein